LHKAKKIFNLHLDSGLSLAIVDSIEMRKINQTYRSKDKPTDVLSFDYGEIILCPEYIIEKYGMNKKDIQSSELHRKMMELFVHGLVHLAGFDHKSQRDEKEMQKLEEKILL
jgi:probable rRNA maturation factor